MFVKERLEELGTRRQQLETSVDEVALLCGDVEREAVDAKLVTEALANFTEVFEHIPPYKRKELIRLVLHKAVVSKDGIELALYGKPPNVSEMPQEGSRS